MHISGIAVVSSIAIPETVSLSSLQFQVSHNTSAKVMNVDIKFNNTASRINMYYKYNTNLPMLVVDTIKNIITHYTELHANYEH